MLELTIPLTDLHYDTVFTSMLMANSTLPGEGCCLLRRPLEKCVGPSWNHSPERTGVTQQQCMYAQTQQQ